MTTAAPARATRSVAFEAFGRPVPQGSMRSLGKGRPSVHSNKALLLPWRQTIAVAAASGATAHGWDRTPGPVKVTARFFFDRPLGHYTKKGLRPGAPVVPFGRGVGDLDKLVRAVLDAIGDSGAVWLDDSQVVAVGATKRYVPEQPVPGHLLDRPGVLVRVEALP